MKKFSIIAILLGLFLFFPQEQVMADGTETLGPPTISIATGTGIVAAGTGLETQPSTINLNVPTNSTVKQVLLYWSGGAPNNIPGDNIITINGNSVTGTRIGGPTYFYTSITDIWFSSYRADITNLSLISPGSNTLTVADMDFGDAENNGAGVLVIYDDGSPNSQIAIRDGQDLAFINFAEPLKSTVAQTINFAPAPINRLANLAMFFGSVSNEGLRPSSIEVTVNGTKTVYSNLLGSNDGPQWDTVSLPGDAIFPDIVIPAGASSMTVQAFSRDDNGDGQHPLAASFNWIGTALSISPPKYTLGDRIWYDQDQDGVQDPNEPSYPDGLTVDLYTNATCSSSAVQSTTSNGSGFYQFGNLLAGTYSVKFSGIPAGWSISPTNQGSDNAVDSDANGSGCIENINLTANDPTQDIGIYVPGTLGDNVLCVSTGQGLANITVTLFEDFDGNGAPDGPAVATTQTDANGFYQFTGIEVALAGDPNNTTNYIVRVDTNDADLGTCNVPVPPTEYNPPLDSDNPNDPNNDFKFEEPARAALGDFVWNDLNRNGIQDAGEPGIPGVTVTLLDCNGNQIANTTTNANGLYSFSNLTPGCYVVMFNAPSGFVFSPANQGGDDAKDSDADTNTGKTGQINLAPGQNNTTVDAGLNQPARFSLGDRVWYDQDQDGIQDPSEPGYPDGLTVDLYTNATCSGSAVQSTTSNGSGFYQFGNLLAGTYSVKFSGIPAGWSISPTNQGSDNAVDSDASGSGCIENINLTANDPTQDIGIYVPGTLGDNVLCISTGQGLANITVTLFADFDGNGAPDGPAVATTQTDANGFYQFTGIEVALAGDPNNTTNYIVRVDTNDADLGTCNVPVPPTEYNPPLDSDNPNDPNNDFKFEEPARAALGDFVWNDLNRNGIQDAGEPGIPGVTITLLDCNGNQIANTTTNANGLYSFSNLTPGCYVVMFNAPSGFVFSPANQGGDDAKDSDADTNTGKTGQINLAPGQNNTTVDAGLNQPPASLGDFVWNDLNRNGIQDAGEPGIPGVTVMLLDCNGNQIASTTTNANGLYSFSNLNPGCYVVMFNAPSGFVFSPANQGGDDAKDSDADTNTGKTGQINLAPGQNNTTVDAGLQTVLTCSLDVLKTCALPLVPTTPFVCSDAKPIDKLEMIWNGAQTVNIKAWKGSVGSTLLATVDGVTPGQKVLVTGYAGSPNDVIWEVFDATSGAKLGESTFHLSCSDDDMDGPEDCGKIQGDGKAKSGFLNLWKLEAMGGNGLEFVCTPAPQPSASSCEFVAGPGPSCTTLGKPTTLTFKYTGGSCATSTNPQSGKATCTGGINNSLPMMVSSSISEYTINPATVNPGQEFTVSAGSFKADSFFTLSNAGGTQSLKIHTSCSQVLQVGDVFGALTLVAFNNQRAGTDVTYGYSVTNNGDALTNMTLVDDKLGAVAGPFSLAPGQTQTFEKVATIESTTTNIGTFTGFLANGALCTASDSATVTVLPCRAEAATTLDFHDKEIRWNITNPGLGGLTISRIAITWPAGNGALDEIKRDKDTVHKGDFPAPSATITSGWEGNEDKRTIKAGETDTLKFKFKNNVVTTGEHLLTVDFQQGCSVTIRYTPGIPPTGAFTCSKPIDSISMIWDGAPEIGVKAWKGSVGSTLLGTFSTVNAGNELTVSGYAGSPNDVIWEIFTPGLGSKIGESTFHLSCSDADMNSADDCAKRQGDGKGKSGFINDWLLEGIVDSNETLDCTQPVTSTSAARNIATDQDDSSTLIPRIFLPSVEK